MFTLRRFVSSLPIPILLAASLASADPLVPGHLLVVTDFGDLETVDPATGTATPFGELPGPAGSRLAFDPQGDVLARDGVTGAVLRIDRDTAEVTPLSSGDFLEGALASSVAVAADGVDVLASVERATQPRGRIVRVAPGGGQDLEAEGSFSPTAIAVEADGSIVFTTGDFVLDMVAHPNGGVLRVDPGTGDVSIVSTGQFFDNPLGPVDLEIRPNGTLVVLDGAVLVLVDPATGVQTLVPGPTSFDPDIEVDIVTGFTQDGADAYYLTTGHDVLDETFPGGVVRVVPGGHASSTTGPSEFTSPVDVAVIPAPEPAGPLLLAAGGALLLAIRRRMH